MATTNTADAVTTDDITRAHAIAARASCDHRTALRALQHGPSVIRTRVVRERVTLAMREIEGACG